jgi:hypothetical protein
LPIIGAPKVITAWTGKELLLETPGRQQGQRPAEAVAGHPERPLLRLQGLVDGRV